MKDKNTEADECLKCGLVHGSECTRCLFCYGKNGEHSETCKSGNYIPSKDKDAVSNFQSGYKKGQISAFNEAIESIDSMIDKNTSEGCKTGYTLAKAAIRQLIEIAER